VTLASCQVVTAFEGNDFCINAKVNYIKMEITLLSLFKRTISAESEMYLNQKEGEVEETAHRR
jgi:hypothetical protein